MKNLQAAAAVATIIGAAAAVYSLSAAAPKRGESTEPEHVLLEPTTGTISEGFTFRAFPNEAMLLSKNISFSHVTRAGSVGGENVECKFLLNGNLESLQVLSTLEFNEGPNVCKITPTSSAGFWWATGCNYYLRCDTR
jgi:hypothetical protein